MSETKFDGILFGDHWQELDMVRRMGRVDHILALQGNMGFTFQETHYNISSGDYVILTNSALVSDFSTSDNFRGIYMNLSENYVTSIAIRSNYGIIGHLSLLRNPVIKLNEKDFRVCETALNYLRWRMEDETHLFREEMLGGLLTAHILDIYDIHARRAKEREVSEQISQLIRKFIELLYNGEYLYHRNLEHYASQLYITPHYLSEICKKVSGKPASYWIDRFTLQEITRLLREKELSLTEIADRLNFSSLSYFSRYVQKNLNISPSLYRQNLTAH